MPVVFSMHHPLGGTGYSTQHYWLPSWTAGSRRGFAVTWCNDGNWQNSHWCGGKFGNNKAWYNSSSLDKFPRTHYLISSSNFVRTITCHATKMDNVITTSKPSKFTKLQNSVKIF